MILKIAWKNLVHNRLSSLLSWVLLSVSVGIISLLVLMQQQLEKQFTGNIKNVDMVIGAKGSPLQLILSAVYHIDAPTGNIKYDEVKKWMVHPYVESAIPLAYGDSYKGYSILGTNKAYLDEYGASLQSGRFYQNNFEVVVGSNVTKTSQLKTGEVFYGTHGDRENGEVHKAHPYKVVGVINPGAGVVDNLITGNVESVWAMHEHEEEQGSTVADSNAHHEEEPVETGSDSAANQDEEMEPEKEITAVLIKFRNPMGLIQLPRIINENTNMMAAVPAIEINRLFTLFGVGIDTLKAFGWGIMCLSGLSVFIALYNSLKERKYEMALMRTMGAGRLKLVLLLLLEAIILCVGAYITGLLLSRAGLWFIGKSVAKNYHFNLNDMGFQWPDEIYLLGFALIIGVVAALIPSIRAGRLNISKTLSNG